MSNITLIINTVALWVIIVCQILESKQFSKTLKSNEDLTMENIELQTKIDSFEKRIFNVEERLSDSAVTEVQKKQAEIKFELQRIDKTASNNREKIMALQEANRNQQRFNKDFDVAIKRVGRRK